VLCRLHPPNDHSTLRTGMKNFIFATFYTLGLSAMWPLLMAANHSSSAAWPMLLAPMIAAGFAEVFSRLIQFTKVKAENKVIWLIAGFILLSQVAKFALGLVASNGYIEYLALNALYQILLLLVFSESMKREPKASDLGRGHLLV